jgi:hypothetical protein
VPKMVYWDGRWPFTSSHSPWDWFHRLMFQYVQFLLCFFWGGW